MPRAEAGASSVMAGLDPAIGRGMAVLLMMAGSVPAVTTRRMISLERA